MELKDVVLSTIAEMQSDQEENQTPHQAPKKDEIPQSIDTDSSKAVDSNLNESSQISDEIHFLQSVRERLLVLFEGFQSPNNKEIEAKVDLTLNFLEYLLSTIDVRLEALTKGKE